MELFSILLGVGIFLTIILVPLGITVWGMALIAGAAKTINEVVKGNKDGK
jgi:hypothetical protein